jgi:uncharacterized membrane protein
MIHRVAVVIGINYTHFPEGTPSDTATRAGVNPLRFAEADAQEMTATLQTSGYDVLTLLGQGATRRAILDALREQSRKAGQDGLLLVHFSGHGEVDPDDGDTAYLLPVDADPHNPRDLAIPLDDLAERLLGRVSLALTLLDCCHSGYAVGMKGGAVAGDGGQEFMRLAQRTFRNVRGRIVLTACAGSQLARETAALRHGVFTYYTLDWWRHSQEVDDLSLASYVAAALEKEGLPAPVRGGVQEGRLLLRPPAPPARAHEGADATPGPPAAPRPPADLAWRQAMHRELRALDAKQLRLLCYLLGLDYDALPGEDYQAKTLRFVLDMEAAGRAAELSAAAADAATRQARDRDLHRRLEAHLETRRLPDLCRALDFDYRLLPGAEPGEKIRSLIDEVEWAGRFEELRAAARRAFQQQAWDAGATTANAASVAAPAEPGTGRAAEDDIIWFPVTLEPVKAALPAPPVAAPVDPEEVKSPAARRRPPQPKEAQPLPVRRIPAAGEEMAPPRPPAKVAGSGEARPSDGSALRRLAQIPSGVAFLALFLWAVGALNIPPPYDSLGVAIPLFFGVCFGPVVGLVVGAAGPAIADQITGGGYPMQFWIAYGLMGVIAGLTPALAPRRASVRGVVSAALFSGLGVGAGTAAIAAFEVLVNHVSEADISSHMSALVTNKMIVAVALVPALAVIYEKLRERPRPG